MEFNININTINICSSHNVKRKVGEGYSPWLNTTIYITQVLYLNHREEAYN